MALLCASLLTSREIMAKTKPYLYFITGNPGKFSEVQKLIPNIQQLNIDLPEIQSLSSREVIKQKLLEARKHHKGELLVEDTELSIDCLNGFPGAFIKFFEESLGLKGISELVSKYKTHTATTKSVFGFCDKDGKVTFYEGIQKGKIVSPRGKNGFGFDPIFQPINQSKTYAEISGKEKEKYKMRKIALQEFLKTNETYK